VREVQEETGLVVSLERLIGVYSTPGERTIFVAYAGRPVGGEMAPGEECFDVAVFAPSELPDLAFPHDREIVEAWASGAGSPVASSAPPSDNQTSGAMA
jgi:ADP-ribose pyrophosphatase YjhB (NUDIX family)